MQNVTPKETLLSLFLIRIRPFIEFFNSLSNSMEELGDNGLETEILIYSASIDSIIRPDPSLIQLSILYKISWKDLLRSYLELFTALVVELK